MKAVVLYLMLAAPALSAQTTYGRIMGRLVDTTGAVVPGAAVRITNVATNVATNLTSDSQGNYDARTLIPGNYRVNVEVQGFKGYQRGVNVYQVSGGVMTWVRKGSTKERERLTRLSDGSGYGDETMARQLMATVRRERSPARGEERNAAA